MPARQIPAIGEIIDVRPDFRIALTIGSISEVYLLGVEHFASWKLENALEHNGANFLCNYTT